MAQWNFAAHASVARNASIPLPRFALKMREGLYNMESASAP
jgi:hypothetical protein